ncbi:hypothetical protein N7475_000519 [Penicillium sp. IBT 31633x]|nr:hypothetical protein N7475_000519 [Penicillium sp. IBT 31633x]
MKSLQQFLSGSNISVVIKGAVNRLGFSHSTFVGGGAKLLAAVSDVANGGDDLMLFIGWKEKIFTIKNNKEKEKNMPLVR